ncbi:hypothetical protein MMC30_003069 [Trapelia coarctata]|nr:hypothetical protein [Trapelia coarctata]
MLRQTLFNSTAKVVRSSTVARRALSVSFARMAEGDVGGIRAGGSASSDAFNKREKANEDYYVKQKEKEKYVHLYPNSTHIPGAFEKQWLILSLFPRLMALKTKLAEQQKHLAELSAHIDEMAKESGGEKN